MQETCVRRLGNVRKFGSKACKCQKLGLGGWEKLETFCSNAWESQKVWFEGKEMSESWV